MRAASFPAILVVLTLASLAPLACEDGARAGDDGNGDTDTPTGGDSDSDTHTGADSDADTDADGDADTDADADTDTVTDTDTGTGTGTGGCDDMDSDDWCAELDCNDTDPDVNPDAVEQSGNGLDDDCDGETDELEETDTDTTCSEEDFAVEPEPVRIMILQDKSSSMTEGSPSKWDQAVGALTTTLNTYAGPLIEFGFDIFPNSGNCNVSDPVIHDCLAGQESQIVTWLNTHDADGASTPLYCGMAAFLDAAYAPLFTAVDASSYLLVVSDGADLCGEGCCVPINPFNGKCNATTSEFSQLTKDLLAKGVRSIVIGFGADASPDQLNAIASNGGTSFTSYLDAQNQQDLEDALESVAQSVVSCTYAINPQDPFDPNVINFYFDGALVPYDDDCVPGNGWRWTDSTHTSIEFCPGACSQLQGGTVDTVNAKYGCPTEVE
jgi:hypothetical protein